MRRKYPKGTDFTNVTQKEINAAASWANGIFRESLDYYSADEMYNLYVSNQVETLPPLT
jgi:IS30 family transposase